MLPTLGHPPPAMHLQTAEDVQMMAELPPQLSAQLAIETNRPLIAKCLLFHVLDNQSILSLLTCIFPSTVPPTQAHTYHLLRAACHMHHLLLAPPTHCRPTRTTYYVLHATCITYDLHLLLTAGPHVPPTTCCMPHASPTTCTYYSLQSHTYHLLRAACHTHHLLLAPTTHCRPTRTTYYALQVVTQEGHDFPHPLPTTASYHYLRIPTATYVPLPTRSSHEKAMSYMQCTSSSVGSQRGSYYLPHQLLTTANYHRRTH